MKKLLIIGIMLILLSIPVLGDLFCDCDDDDPRDPTCPELYFPERCKGGGCFIATAAYGTPFTEELDVLRYWRDNSLNTNWAGKQLVNLYYATSPPIADYIRDKPTLRAGVRKILDPFVKYLKIKQEVN